ncbi:MAG TPA: HNH endonuclease signature motif containing protein [Bryobacteraceae bacterium]|nr:HNH endonuclease signature motif containing protein [Bryobacteraceae bacterium]
MKKASRPGAIHQRIVDVMKRFPDGISGGQIRQQLEREGLRPEDQTHLDRRKRDLKKWFIIKTVESAQVVNGKSRKVTLYRYGGKRKDITDEGDVSIRVKAEVLHAAHGRCQMCGKTVAEDEIKLVVDHKKPRAWGGTNDRENLWAICVPCNSGKKAYFNSLNVTDDFMKKVTAHESIHVRIGETLKAVGIGKRTPPEILEVVADQEDWHKRLRELRYPVIGWAINTIGYKTESGRKKVDYILRSYKAWPEDPTGKIRRFERDRERRNKGEDD